MEALDVSFRDSDIFCKQAKADILNHNSIGSNMYKKFKGEMIYHKK